MVMVLALMEFVWTRSGSDRKWRWRSSGSSCRCVVESGRGIAKVRPPGRFCVGVKARVP